MSNVFNCYVVKCSFTQVVTCGLPPPPVTLKGVLEPRIDQYVLDSSVPKTDVTANFSKRPKDYARHPHKCSRLSFLSKISHASKKTEFQRLSLIKLYNSNNEDHEEQSENKS